MTLRFASPTDIGAVAMLIRACELADVGEPDTSEEDLAAEWRQEGFEPGRDAWVVEERGRLVAYGRAWQRERGRFDAEGYVHPEARGRGLGAELVRLAEERAQEAGAERVSNWILASDADAVRLLSERGYVPVRHYFRMAVDLEGELPPASVAEGTVLRSFEPDGDTRAVYDTVEEAFEDEPGHVRTSFEEWSRRTFERGDFDPSLWVVAVEGEEVIGAAVCSPSPGGGFVDALAVRRRWRRRGLGLALLQEAFRRFAARGFRRAALTVDAANPSGATRLYERAGMRVHFGFDRYEKKLRE